MDVGAIHRLLAVAEVGRDPYAVAEVALGLLEGNAGDVVARGHYVRALLAMKLTAAAQREANGPAGSGGVVAWGSRGRRFAANLRALAGKDPEGAEVVRAAELSRYELHLAADGNYHVFDLERKQWLGRLANHQAARGMWQFDAKKTPMPMPLVFEGLGFGWLFLHVLATTVRTFVDYSCALHVVEGDGPGLAMLLHMQDLQEAIGDMRTRWFVRGTGAEAVRAFREKVMGDETITVPGQHVRCSLRGGVGLAMEEVLEGMRGERRVKREQVVAVGREFYRGKDAAYWAGRFEDALSGRGEKLRVLGITSRYTTVLRHSMAEMQAAVIGEFGQRCEMQVAMEPDDQSLENPFVEKVAEFRPDLIVQLSRLRYENPLVPREVPFLCWDQDNLASMRTAEATASLDALTYVAGHGAVFGFTTLGWRRENCVFVHPAGATHRYHDGAVEAGLRAKHACDFSYVSNASGTAEGMAEQMRAKWKRNEEWLRVFDRAAGIVVGESQAGGCWEYVGLKNLARRVAGEEGVALEESLWREMIGDLNTYADRCFRHTALAWVARWCERQGKSLRLYGRGWEGHPALGKYATGVAEPGEEARAIYRATKVNLQLIEPGFIHSRALDGIAAGGFFLTRRTAADGVGEEGVRTLYELARWTVDHGVGSDAELEAVEDDRVRKMVAATKRYFLSHEVQEPMWRSLQVWAAAPAAGMVFPRLGEVTFRDEASFGMLAEKFLGDDAGRQAMAAEMRRVVLGKFSYGARWKDFVGAVQAGLAKAAQLVARG